MGLIIFLHDQYPVAIKKAKAEDLRKLVTKYIPTAHRGFYSELPIVDMDNDTVTKALCYIHISMRSCIICIFMHVLSVGDYCITM